MCPTDIKATGLSIPGRVHNEWIVEYRIALTFRGSKFSQIWSRSQNYFSDNFETMVLAY